MSVPGFKTPYDNVDTVLIRENTEGEYSGIEHEVVDGVVQSIKLITRRASERVLRFGFQYAESINKAHIRVVHKATIMKMSDGLFVSTARDVAKDFPEIKFDTELLDNTCLKVCGGRCADGPTEIDIFPADGYRPFRVPADGLGHA